jgi:hypothetical protein
MTDPETRLRLRAEDVSWREVGDEAVVLESATGTYLTLNASGKLLWQALERGATEGEMVTMLVEQYGIGEELAAADVGTFLDRLRERQLVEAEGA